MEITERGLFRRTPLLVAVTDERGITFHTNEKPQFVAWQDVRRVKIRRGELTLFTGRGPASLPFRGLTSDASAIEQEIRGRCTVNGVPVDDRR